MVCSLGDGRVPVQAGTREPVLITSAALFGVRPCAYCHRISLKLPATFSRIESSSNSWARNVSTGRLMALSVLVHGAGLDRLYALLHLGGFFVVAEGAEGLGLDGQLRNQDGVIRAVLLFQDGKKVFVAGFGLLRSAPKIVSAAKRSLIGQGLRAIMTVECFVNLNGAQENRLRLGEVLLKSVHASQHPEAVGYAGTVLAVGLQIQFDRAVEELLGRSDVLLRKCLHAEVLKWVG